MASVGFSLGLATGNAAYIIDLDQVGSDVVATGSGSIDFRGFTFQGFDNPLSPGVSAGGGYLQIGNVNGYGDYYSPIFGPASFGSATSQLPARPPVPSQG